MTAAIRAATADDAEELARLRWEFRLEVGTRSRLTRTAFVQEMRGFVTDVFVEGSPWRVWVATDDARAVGCVWMQLVERVPHPDLGRWERPIAYVTNMYVEPERRDAGLGRELLEVALGFARDRGASGAVLWPSSRSVPFYERAGFGTDGGPLWLEIAGD